MYIFSSGVSFRTVNSARSAFASFLFGQGFFSHYDEGTTIQDPDEEDETIKCKVAMKVSKVTVFFIIIIVICNSRFFENILESLWAKREMSDIQVALWERSSCMVCSWGICCLLAVNYSNDFPCFETWHLDCFLRKLLMLLPFWPTVPPYVNAGEKCGMIW